MPDWLPFVTQGGAISIIAVAWWIERERCKTEREERLALQTAYNARRDAIEERLITAVLNATLAIREATDAQQALKGAIEAQKNTLNFIATGRKE